MNKLPFTPRVFRRSFTTSRLLVMGLLVFPFLLSHGFVKNWINPEGGSFHEGANWDPFGAPWDQEDAVFKLGQETPYGVTFGQNAIIFNLIVETDSVAMDLGGHEFIVYDTLVADGSDAVGHLEIRNGDLIVDRNLQVGQSAGSHGTFIFENGIIDIDDRFRGPMNNTAYARIELHNAIVNTGQWGVLRDADVELRGTTLVTLEHDIRFANAGDAAVQHVAKVLVADGSHVISNRNYASSNNAMNMTELTVTGPGTIFEVTGEITGGDYNGAWLGDAVTLVEDGALMRIANVFRPGGAGVEEFTVNNAMVEAPGTVLFAHRSEVPGEGGTCVFTLENNAAMTSGVLQSFGFADYSTAHVTMKGGSSWTSEVAALAIGGANGSAGTLSIMEGSVMSLTDGGFFQIASVAGSTGSLTVSGEGSRLEGVDNLYVGGSVKTAVPVEGTGQFAVPEDPPAELPVTEGLAVWYSAGQLGLNEGDPVGMWADLSGHGRHLSQPNAEFQPTFVANAANGKPAVRFDGVNDHIYHPDRFDPEIGQPNHVFMVIFANNPTGGRVFDRNASAGGGRQTARTYADRLNAWASSNLNGPLVESAWENWQLFEVAYNGVGAYVNGKTLSSLPLDAGNIGANSMGSLVLGSHADFTTNFYDGDIAEFLVYDRTLDEAEIEAIENYLGGKYSLPLAVPGSEDVEYVGSGGFGSLEVASGGNLDVSGEVFVWETGSLSVNGGNIGAGELWFAEALRQVEIQTPVQKVPEGAAELPVSDGLALWYDAAQLGLNDGDPVAQWSDLSGNDRHLSQESTDSRPTFVTDAVAGHPVVRFDGINDHLFTPDLFDPEIVQPNHLFVVVRTNNPTSGRLFDTPDVVGGGRQTARPRSDHFNAWAGANLNGGVSNWEPWHLFEVLYNGADSHVNGKTISGLTLNTGNIGDRNLGSIVLGSWRAMNGEFFDGDVAEFIMFDRALDAGEVEQVENYLAAKYELPLWEMESTFVDAGPEFNVVLGAGANPYITVGGDVNLGQVAALNVTLAPGFEPASGQTFDLIGYGGSLSGNFAGLPEGAVAQAGGFAFAVSYQDGAVTLTETSVSPGVPFADWIAGFDLPPGEDLPLANPAGDGIPNAVKFALGLDPRVAARGGLPSTSVESEAGEEYLTLEVAKNPEAVGVDYIVEVSSDLALWESGPGHVTIVEETGTLLKARDNTPMMGTASRFIRVRIEMDVNP